MVNGIKVAEMESGRFFCLSLFNNIMNKIFTGLKVNDCFSLIHWQRFYFLSSCFITSFSKTLINNRKRVKFLNVVIVQCMDVLQYSNSFSLYLMNLTKLGNKDLLSTDLRRETKLAYHKGSSTFSNSFIRG